MTQQAYTSPTVAQRKRKMAAVSYDTPFFLKLSLILILSSSHLAIIFPPLYSVSAVPKHKLPVSDTRAQCSPSVRSSWSPFKYAALGILLRPILILLALPLRHDSAVEGERGRKPRQTVGSQPDCKKDRWGGGEAKEDGRRSRQVEFTSILWSGSSSC